MVVADPLLLPDWAVKRNEMRADGSQINAMRRNEILSCSGKGFADCLLRVSLHSKNQKKKKKNKKKKKCKKNFLKQITEEQK